MDQDKLKQMQQMLEAYQQLTATVTILHSDFEVSAEMYNKERSQFWCRTLVRAFFAHVEGVINCMRRIAYVCRFQPDVNFSAGEESILSQETYELDDKGEVRVKKARTPLRGYIKLCFKAYARVHLTQYELTVGDSRWDDFGKSIQVRDRLMHPKEEIDLTVTEDEIQMLHRAYLWFDENLQNVMKQSEKAMVENAQTNQVRGRS